LGDIDAEAIYPGLQSGIDGMLFDNYTVTAEPEPAPRIVLGPQNQTVTVGNNLVLGVIASGSPTLMYQWYSNREPILGATSAGLWLANATLAESGSYTVVVSNATGSATAGCVVTVSDPQPNLVMASPISVGISGQRLNFNVISGNTYQLQASTNLTVWSTLGSFYANGSSATYFDAAAASLPRRFYRLATP
jgi:hypothetical protein